MKDYVFDTTARILDELMGLESDSERQEVFAALSLIFCTGCGRMESVSTIARTSISHACVHGTGPNGIIERQQLLDARDADTKRVALSLVKGETYEPT